MNNKQTDTKPDIYPAQDRGESVTLMEPLVIGDAAPERAELTDLALDLVRRSSGFYRSLPPPIVMPLANLVRAMNCHYSNLIEGHDTHPIDIERALKNDYSNDVRKRDLQLEAKAHIAVQEWIDCDGLKGRPVSTDGIREVHRRFCEHLPEDLLWVEEPQTKERMRVIPGELRRRDVTVGRHIPVSPGALTRFLKRFEKTYRHLGKAESIIAAAAAHHRFLWMHPFLDGNGRVARLMSYAMLLETADRCGLVGCQRTRTRCADLQEPSG
jgi:Fic family protein